MNHTPSAIGAIHTITPRVELSSPRPLKKTDTVSHSDSTLILDPPIPQLSPEEPTHSSTKSSAAQHPPSLVAVPVSKRLSEIIDSRAEIMAFIQEANATEKRLLEIEKKKREEEGLVKEDALATKVFKIEDERPC